MAAVTSVHQPVMFDEVMAALAPRPGGTYLDGTVGGGGHAAGLLERAAPDGRLLGLDRDPAAVAWAGNHLARFGARAILVCGNFADLERLASEHGFDLFDGIVLDLGMSSDQVDDPARGFSFRSDGPLDMRMDPAGPLTAADLVNTWDAGALADVLFQYGEEHRARRIARAIVAARPIRSTGHLAAVVERAAGGHHGGIHPATRTFQALRIAVNEELAALEAVLPQAVRRLAVGGRLAVISFHSLEDRTVKHTLRAAAASCVCPPEVPECRCQHQATLRLVTRKPITPTASETDANPRARSARMRVAERLPAD